MVVVTLPPSSGRPRAGEVMAQVADPIAELSSGLDALGAADPARLADCESIRALHRQLERLEAVTARATAAFDSSRTWEADGARSAGAWISTRCHLPLPSAKRRMRLGRQLRHMPLVEADWLAGEITGSHVSLLARARTPATAEAFARDEAMLCDHARRLRFHSFVRALAYWRYRVNPGGSEDDALDQAEGRRVHLSRSFEGMWFLDGALDPIAGTIVDDALREIEDELFDDDWAEAKARLGDELAAQDLRRTRAQRRADALVEMARRSRAVPAGARLPEPLFSVLVGYETFAGPMCQLANGAVVTPGSLLPHLDQAWVERVVFEAPSRVLDVGERRRLFSGATRRAVQIKSQECFHEFCDIPADHCEVDHIEPWAAGGLTVQENGRCACGYHNRERHRRS
jgi:hypothetical protein